MSKGLGINAERLIELDMQVGKLLYEWNNDHGSIKTIHPMWLDFFTRLSNQNIETYKEYYDIYYPQSYKMSEKWDRTFFNLVQEEYDKNEFNRKIKGYIDE